MGLRVFFPIQQPAPSPPELNRFSKSFGTTGGKLGTLGPIESFHQLFGKWAPLARTTPRFAESPPSPLFPILIPGPNWLILSAALNQPAFWKFSNPPPTLFGITTLDGTVASYHPALASSASIAPTLSCFKSSHLSPIATNSLCTTQSRPGRPVAMQGSSAPPVFAFSASPSHPPNFAPI